ncbi:Thioredoxin, partial [Globisporangium splendens]
MSTICIGGFCFPVYALFPIALIVLQSLWEWVRVNVLGHNDAALFENSRVIHVKSVEQFKELHQKSKDTKRSEISRGCGVTAMPTFQFFRNGTKCDELRGADKNALEEKIKKHYMEVELPEDENPVSESHQKQADGNGGELRQRKPNVVKVASDDQWKELLEKNATSGKAMIVDFWASWCQPCMAVAPFFEALSAKYPSVVFVKVDADEMEEITNAFDVSTLPTFKVFKQGKVVDELSGAIQSALESTVAKHA